MSQNIAITLQQQARVRPGQPAIIDTVRGQPRSTTFAVLADHVARAVSFLDGFGLQPGDPVLVFQPMSLELYVALIALFQRGSVAMFLDPSAGRAHIDRCCAMSPPKLFIGSAKAHLLRLLSPGVRKIPRKIVVDSEGGGWIPGAVRGSDAQKCPPSNATFNALPDSPALLTFTSGSTGQPKAALRTHGFLLAQHAALEKALAMEAGAVDLTTLPIFVLSNLAAGVTSVIPNADLRKPGSIDPAPVFEQVRQYQPATSGASPALFERLAAHHEATGEMLSSLRRIYTGGAPVFPRLMDRLAAAAPDAEIYAVYGSTEAEPIAHIGLSEISSADRDAMVGGKGLLTGEPVEEIALRILPVRWGTPLGPFTKAEFDDLALRPNEPGEIVVSGNHVLKGYVNGTGDLETKFRVDGAVWHRTGDAGYRDGRGRVWLLGRCSARIEDENGVVYPFAVECAALEDASVARAALIALDGKRLLVVEPAAKQSVDIDSLKSRLSWSHLARVITIAKIPVDKRHNAKIDYPALVRLISRA